MKDSIKKLSWIISNLDLGQMRSVRELIRTTTGKLLILGNGGSNAVASHIAEDFSKNYKPALAFSDSPMLSCFANDFGWDGAYLEWLTRFIEERDLTILISSSGQSENILRCANWLKSQKLPFITMSGFESLNPLRKHGDISIYIPSFDYGHVETTHQVILHTVLDDLVMEKKGANTYV